MKRLENIDRVFLRFSWVIFVLFTTSCYVNPIFKKTVDGVLKKSQTGLSSVLSLLGLSTVFLTEPTGARAEIRFSKADGSVYSDKVVATGESEAANIRVLRRALSNIFYTDNDGKVTIYFPKLDTTYSIEIRERSGTVLAKIKIKVPRNVNSNLDLIPAVEFGDIITNVLSTSPIGGSIPASLSYAGSPFIFTKDVAIPPITPTFSGVITDCQAIPSLPPGIVLGSTDCALSGTPTSTSPVTTYAIRASNSFGSTSNEIIMSVTVAPPTNLVYPNAPFLFTTSLAITSQTPTYTGTISSCSVTPVLPAGLSIDSSTCTLSGTPSSVSGTTNYTVTGSNSNGSASVVISITVNDVPPSALTYAGTPFTFTQGLAINTATPTFSGSVTSCTSSPTLPTGLVINGTSCEITGTPTTSQGITPYVITATNPYGSTTANIQITVNIAPPASLVYAGSPFVFTQNVIIANQTPTFTGTVTSCSSSPSLPTGLGINPSTCAITGTPTAIQGLTNYTITATNSSGSTQANIDITINIAAPTALSYTGSPFTFTQNATISALTPTYSGSVTSCTASPSLPTGLGINPTTCAITGTPTVTQGLTAHTITATNSSGSTNTSISITVNDFPPTGLSYAGTPFTFTRTVSIGTLTPSVTGTITNCVSSPILPTGVSISTTTCALTGTPTAIQGNTAYVITASNVSGNTTANINITIINPNCQLDSATLDSCILP